MGKLPGHQRPVVGQRANVRKRKCSRCCKSAKAPSKKRRWKHASPAKRSMSHCRRCRPTGHRHPPLSTTDSIVDIFCGLGYQVVEGPDIESDYNFSALNIPEEHPARDYGTTSTCRAIAAHPHLTSADQASGEQCTARAHRGPRAGVPA